MIEIVAFFIGLILSYGAGKIVDSIIPRVEKNLLKMKTKKVKWKNLTQKK